MLAHVTWICFTFFSCANFCMLIESENKTIRRDESRFDCDYTFTSTSDCSVLLLFASSRYPATAERVFFHF